MKKRTTLVNPYPEQERTHERQRGDGNTPAEGEQHDESKKARVIPPERRYPGAPSGKE